MRMENSQPPMGKAELSRRDIIKMCAGAAAFAAIERPARLWAQSAGPIHGVIDCHAHWQPEAYLTAMKDLGKPVNNANPFNYDLDKRLKRMDEQANSPTRSLSRPRAVQLPAGQKSGWRLAAGSRAGSRTWAF